ncbi:MAG TPA: polysaccharide export protein EpsE [Burkholderiales bacterium]|nr:polysaccharide export protein EpsE [Burkholderiales bacterium]
MHSTLLYLSRWCALLAFGLTGLVHAQNGATILGPGDVIRISVFQNPDLTLETRVPENGEISYPLIGNVKLGGLSVPAAEARIAKMLRDGGFVKQPQVNILLSQVRSAMVSVLGEVAKPGAYPLDKPYRVSEMLAVAGGITPGGADTVIITRNDGSRTTSATVDVAQMYLRSDTAKDALLNPGDVIYVQRAPKFYIYGEVQKPGSYRLERGMTVQQALAEGGGVTPRGTERGLEVHRHDANGASKPQELPMHELLRDADVIYVKERLF